MILSEKYCFSKEFYGFLFLCFAQSNMLFFSKQNNNVFPKKQMKMKVFGSRTKIYTVLDHTCFLGPNSCLCSACVMSSTFAF